jgi:dihydroflavonol-4-reductase
LGHLAIASRGVPGESYLLGSENLSWREIHGTIADLTGVARPAVELNHMQAYLAATADELRAHFRGGEPLSSRDQATMIGRYYWYSHAHAGRLGYAPASGRTALVEAVSWLVTTPHISREIRAGLRLSPEIYQFRANQLASA